MRRQDISHAPLTPNLGTPVQFLKGVGPKRAEALARLGIRTVADALYLRPLRHEDRRQLRPIRDLQPDLHGTVVGEVKGASVIRTRRRVSFLSVIIGDGTGTLVAKWFGQPYLKYRFPRGRRIILSGKVTWGAGPEMVNPDYEEWEDKGRTHPGRLVPVYPLVGGLFQRWLRTFMNGLAMEWIPVVRDFLPEGVRHRHGLISLRDAFRGIHFPEGTGDLEAGKRRLAFDDLLLLSLGVGRLRQAVEKEVAAAMAGDSDLEQAVRGRLGFPLTSSQEKVLNEIKADMARSRPMTRLLQGDVGSGKTAVALLAMIHAVGSGFQGAIMVPTEILAEQHLVQAQALLQPVGLRVGLLSRGITRREREDLRQSIAAGQIQVVIGTHALLQEAVTFHRLGFVIVDEQHRFGVKQRAGLTAKGSRPHTLVMTATPIPRTLALTLYGDLDLSIIHELPPGRQPVKTELLPEEMRLEAYRFVREEIRRGGAAYIICPLVEENEEADLRAATSLVHELEQGIFQENTVGCLHGRMRAPEKSKVLEAFRSGHTQVLVATTVVEVGMDVPRATVVVVEHAERLGLTQLHQIRGRVGRAHDQAYCILIHGKHLTEQGHARLQAMAECADGFQIAERDLELRGPGEFFGARQAGFPDLEMTYLLQDLQLLEAARREAFSLLEEDAGLTRHPLLADALRQRWEGTFALATVG